jgi:hypothetical protein
VRAAGERNTPRRRHAALTTPSAKLSSVSVTVRRVEPEHAVLANSGRTPHGAFRRADEDRVEQAGGAGELQDATNAAISRMRMVRPRGIGLTPRTPAR